MEDNVLTIGDYLSGKVRNITVPDTTIASIIMDAGCTTVEVEVETTDEVSGETTTTTQTQQVTKDTDVTLLTEQQRELCLAWLYVWISGSPTQTGATRDADADWEHSEGGERMSANVLKRYLTMANDIFDKYDLPLVDDDSWGFVGRGFRNPRK